MSKRASKSIEQPTFSDGTRPRRIIIANSSDPLLNGVWVYCGRGRMRRASALKMHYVMVEAVSVLLDNRKHDITYQGTIFRPFEVALVSTRVDSGACKT